MSNYFDNQSKGWAWNVSKDGVYLTTDHGSHTHTLELTNVSIQDMAEKTGKIMGDAHRIASHDYINEQVQNSIMVTERGNQTMSKNKEYRDGIKVSDEIISKTVEIGKNYENNIKSNQGGSEDGARGRDETGPGNQGRVAEYKAVSKETITPIVNNTQESKQDTENKTDAEIEAKNLIETIENEAINNESDSKEEAVEFKNTIENETVSNPFSTDNEEDVFDMGLDQPLGTVETLSTEGDSLSTGESSGDSLGATHDGPSL